jgi:hypothetical protein
MGEFMRRVQQQEEIIREFMKPDARLLTEWLGGAARL